MRNYIAISPKIYTVEKLAEMLERDNKLDFNRVDNIVLQIGTSFHHLGRICYKEFQVKNNRGLRVCLNSIDTNAIEFASKLITYMASLLLSGKSASTLSGLTSYIIHIFKYIRSAGITLLCEKASIQSFIHSYTSDLLHKIRIYDRKLKLGLSTHTAQVYQSGMLSFFSYVLDVEKSMLTRGLIIIKRNNNQVQSTLKLNDDTFAKEFNLYTKIFRQFSNIILNKVQIPTSVNINGELLWIAPSYNQWLKPKHKNTIGMRGFNYDSGNFYTIEELELIEHNIGKKRYQLTQHVKQAKDASQKMNLEYSSLRLSLASWACKAYFMHFLIITGENDSTAASLLFKDEYLIAKARQNFKTIKWRANGSLVSYDIQSEFIGDFKLYIQLRKYLVDYYQQTYNSLFIGASVGKLANISIKGNASSCFRRLFSEQFTGTQLSGASKSFRVNKSLWIRELYGTEVSSYIMQHSTKTSVSNYSSRDKTEAIIQLTDYFAEIKNLIQQKQIPSASIPSGNCTEYSKPKPLDSLSLKSPIIVKCGNYEGCLYCSKYHIHTDETDIRKLLSVKYIIIHSQAFASSSEHFDNVFKSILKRIDDLLAYMENVQPDCASLIARVSKEVFEHEVLTEYWYRKLELLTDLGF